MVAHGAAFFSDRADHSRYRIVEKLGGGGMGGVQSHATASLRRAKVPAAPTLCMDQGVLRA
jgi:hypothetical protein